MYNFAQYKLHVHNYDVHVHVAPCIVYNWKTTAVYVQLSRKTYMYNIIYNGRIVHKVRKAIYTYSAHMYTVQLLIRYRDLHVCT